MIKSRFTLLKGNKMLKSPFVCRLCLIPIQTPYCIKIFDETNEIPEKILELANIKVLSGDGLPQEVCVLCRYQLDLSITFKRQVIKAASMLCELEARQEGRSPTPVITGDPLSEEVISDPKQVEQPEKKHKTRDKREIDNRSSNWENLPIKVEIDDGFAVAEPWPEEIEEFDTISTTAEETTVDNEAGNKTSVGVECIKNENKELKVKQIITTPVSLENGITQSCTEGREEAVVKENENQGCQHKLNLNCSDSIECNCQFCRDNKNEIKIGSEKPKDGKIKHELCMEKFEKEDILKSHQNDRKQPELFKCARCEKTFMSRKRLCAHQREHTIQQENQQHHEQQVVGVRRSSRTIRPPERHVVPHYSCSRCEKMYSDQAALENHEKSHTIQSFKCNHCGKKCITKELLAKHIQSTHIAKIKIKNHGHECNICGKCYENRSHLFSHMRSHKSTVHLCEVCGKTVSLSAYPAHKRSHLNTSSQEVFECELCQKKFNSKISLRTHKNSYHGTLKFTCEVCGKQFTTMALMRHHQNIHSGKRDHVCQVCNRAFTLKITLKSHMRIHTGEMPYGCDNCGRYFTWKTTYRNHVTTCKKTKPNADVKETFERPTVDIQLVPQTVSQELPIDYSEDTKYEVPIDYSEDTRYRHLSTSETKYFPPALNLSEEIKYPYQQPIKFSSDLKHYYKEFKSSI